MKKHPKLNSKQKGARGERLWRDRLKAFGFKARRGQQFSGASGDPDVVSNIKWVHWEVKLVEKLNIRTAMKQAIDDAKKGTIPIVAHKALRKEWLCTLRGDDLLLLMYCLQKYKEMQK